MNFAAIMGAFLLLGTPGSGGGSPPATPAIAVTDNGDGTGAVATIAGSTGGSSNTVEVANVNASGAIAWTSFGPRTGDGTVALGLSNGRYLAIAASALGGLPAAPSNPYAFAVTGPAGARTVTPVGDFPVALAGLAWLVASSANFQSWVGAGSAAAALSHVTFEADDTEESGSTRPRAIVYPAPEGFEEEKVSLQEYRPHIRLWLSLEAYPSNTIEAETPREDRLWDERLEFLNHVQGVLDDMKAAQGLGTGYTSGLGQITFHSIRLLAGPDTVEEVRAEGQQGETLDYFWSVVFEVAITG